MFAPELIKRSDHPSLVLVFQLPSQRYQLALQLGDDRSDQPEINAFERIKMQLRLAGTSLAQIARELGVQPSTVASVSRGKSRSRRV